MQNPSIPVGNQSSLLDSLPENLSTLQKTPAASDLRGSAVVSENGRSGVRRLPADTKLAIALSLLVHIALALVLSARGMQLQPPVMDATLQATLVTWIDSTRSLEGKRHVDNMAPAPVMDRQKDFLKVKTTAEAHPEASPGQDAKTVLVSDIEPKGMTMGGPDATPAASEKSAGDQHSVSQQASAQSTTGLSVPASYTSVAKPRYRENASPAYPQMARLRGQEGVVLITAEILPEGRTGVLKIKASSGYNLLDQSAIEAVKAWKFDPARKMGKPVIAWVDIPIRFVLKNNP